MREKGIKMKFSFEWRKGKMGFCSSLFFMENNKISEFKMETVVKVRQRS